MNFSSKRINWQLISSMVFFLSSFYFIFGFRFGLFTSNIEDLPLVYKLAGLADYPNDAFVTDHTSHYNVLTPYVGMLAFFVKLFGIAYVKQIYFILYTVIMIFLYLGIRKIILSINEDGNEYLVLITMFILLMADKALLMIPNSRYLFISILDPELLTYPFLLFSIYFFIKKDFGKAAVILFGATIVHPLYTLNLLVGYLIAMMIMLIFNKIDIRRFTKAGIWFIIAVLPYSLLLLFTSKVGQHGEFDASLIEEAMFPLHSVIPTIKSHNRLPYIHFFEANVFLLIIAILLWNIKHKTANILLFRGNENRFLLTILSISLISYLLLVSGISSFIRIPILVDLTPYRIGIIVTILVLIITTTTVFEFFNGNKNEEKTTLSLVISIAAFAMILLISAKGFLSIQDQKQLKSNTNADAAKIMKWVKTNTPKNSLFLNYSNIDVRLAFRSEFFREKTFSMYNKSQIEWYKRLLIYFDIPNDQAHNYKKVANYLNDIHNAINIEQVITKMPIKPDYILIGNNLTDRKLNYQNPNVIFGVGNYKIYKFD